MSEADSSKYVDDGNGGVLYRLCWLFSGNIRKESGKGFLQEAFVALMFNEDARSQGSPYQMRVTHPHNANGGNGDMFIVNTESGNTVHTIESKCYSRYQSLKMNIRTHLDSYKKRDSILVDKAFISDLRKDIPELKDKFVNRIDYAGISSCQAQDVTNLFEKIKLSHQKSFWLDPRNGRLWNFAMVKEAGRTEITIQDMDKATKELKQTATFVQELNKKTFKLTDGVTDKIIHYDVAQGLFYQNSSSASERIGHSTYCRKSEQDWFGLTRTVKEGDGIFDKMTNQAQMTKEKTAWIELSPTGRMVLREGLVSGLTEGGFQLLSDVYSGKPTDEKIQNAFGATAHGFVTGSLGAYLKAKVGTGCFSAACCQTAAAFLVDDLWRLMKGDISHENFVDSCQKKASHLIGQAVGTVLGGPVGGAFGSCLADRYMKWPCKYHHRGCKAWPCRKDKEKHELECPYRPWKYGFGIWCLMLLSLMPLLLIVTLMCFLISEIVQLLMSAIVNLMQSLKSGIVNLMQSLKSGIVNLIESLMSAIVKSLKSGIVNLMQSLMSTIVNLMQSLKSGIVNLMQSLKSGIVNLIESLMSAIVKSLKSGIVNLMQSLKSGIVNLMQSLKSGIVNLMQSLKSGIVNLMQSLKSGIVNLMQSLKSGIVNLMQSLKSGIVNLMQSLKSGMVNLMQSLKSGIVNLMQPLKSGIVNLMQSLKSGIVNLMQSLKSGIVNLIESLMSAIVKSLKMQSLISEIVLVSFKPACKENSTRVLQCPDGTFAAESNYEDHLTEEIQTCVNGTWPEPSVKCYHACPEFKTLNDTDCKVENTERTKTISNCNASLLPPELPENPFPFPLLHDASSPDLLSLQRNGSMLASMTCQDGLWSLDYMACVDTCFGSTRPHADGRAGYRTHGNRIVLCLHSSEITCFGPDHSVKPEDTSFVLDHNVKPNNPILYCVVVAFILFLVLRRLCRMPCCHNACT